jgi:hypothetical protein
MTIQNYLIIESNVVNNICVWDGNTSTWTPPQGSIALVQANTPAMAWTVPTATTESVLQEILGAGDIGFTWDGTLLHTNQPQPIYVPPTP